jgi:hypothetical protein
MATNNAANFGTGVAGQVLTSNGSGASPTFQAVPEEADIKSSPAWLGINNTLLYWNTSPYITSAAITPSSKQTYLVPFSTQGAFTLNRIAVLCAVYSAPLDVLRFGIYTMDGSTGAATLLTDFGTVNATGTGRIGLTALGQAITPGFYYLAVIFNTVNNTYTANSGNVAVVVDTGTGNLIAGFVYNNGSAALPSSISSANLSGTQIVSPPLILINGT